MISTPPSRSSARATCLPPPPPRRNAFRTKSLAKATDGCGRVTESEHGNNFRTVSSAPNLTSGNEASHCPSSLGRSVRRAHCQRRLLKARDPTTLHPWPNARPGRTLLHAIALDSDNLDQEPAGGAQLQYASEGLRPHAGLNKWANNPMDLLLDRTRRLQLDGLSLPFPSGWVRKPNIRLQSTIAHSPSRLANTSLAPTLNKRGSDRSEEAEHHQNDQQPAPQAGPRGAVLGLGAGAAGLDQTPAFLPRRGRLDGPHTEAADCGGRLGS